MQWYRISLVAYIALGVPLLAQEDRPVPGLLTTGTDTLYQYLVRGRDTSFVGTVVDELSIRVRDGRRVFHRVYASDSRLFGISRDTLVDDAETLAPIRSASYSARAIEHVEYVSGRALGWLRQPTGDSVRIDAALPQRVFSSASFDLVLRASQLDDGWRVTIPAFVPSSRVVVSMNARVVREEIIDEMVCWRVDAEFMGMPVTFWIERKSRKLCRQEMRPQAGITVLYTREAPGVRRRGAT